MEHFVANARRYLDRKYPSHGAFGARNRDRFFVKLEQGLKVNTPVSFTLLHMKFVEFVIKGKAPLPPLVSRSMVLRLKHEKYTPPTLKNETTAIE